MNDPPDGDFPNGYFDVTHIRSLIAAGRHREIVGGKWDIAGRMQVRLLAAHGLAPGHRLLDVGCGAFRGGIHFIRYLDAGDYYGIDASQPLIDAGYAHEIEPAGLEQRFPRSNIACNGDFEFPWGVTFHFAIAHSLFTHLPSDRIRLCLTRVAGLMPVGGRLFASYFPVSDHEFGDVQRLRGRLTYPDRDPYHHRLSDLAEASDDLPWHMTSVSQAHWLHPRQRMVMFERA